ncbi:DUF1269 domain-containing protein [Arthrobacter sp. Bz4]|uniref:DUF1269 domain-containing protein n=1 Tax=Arthrobacter sp. Bz4 TaxID=2171979 RepID=UPI000D511769|nr:DUF1269 domain-containing protein [Arthrobacter sp. Bz4]PVE19638.1 hypothetical protein DDA93_02495 [Arthrobacter sp. Bz4]
MVTTGTSALFLLTSGAIVDRVSEAFAGTRMVLLGPNLGWEAADALRNTFSATDHASRETLLCSKPGTPTIGIS